MTDSALTAISSSNITPVIGGRAGATVGGYQTDASRLPFIREQDIGISASGMRPNTRLYVFFDNKLISSHVTPATLDFTISNPQVSDFIPAGIRAQALYSDATGQVAGILHIPAGVFFTGDRLIILIDIDNLQSASAATTSASFTFHSFNYSTNQVVESTVISPRPGGGTVIDQSSHDDTTTNINIVTSEPTALDPANPPPTDPPLLVTNTAFSPFRKTSRFNRIRRARVDPIAQEFYVGSNGLQNSDGVFVTSVDLYFKTRDDTLGVTVDIRTMVNGTPTSTVLPFSSIHVARGSIVIPEPGASPAIEKANRLAAVTTITFPSPVFVGADFSYALCITPDGSNPNYSLYTAAVGQIDVNTDQVITKNWGSGDLFTSTNDQTWVPQLLGFFYQILFF